MFLTEVTSIDQTTKFVANKLLKEPNLDKLCKVFSNDYSAASQISPTGDKETLVPQNKHLFVTSILKHVEYVNVVRIRNIIIFRPGWAHPTDGDPGTRAAHHLS